MLQLLTGTNVVVYLMAAIGILGILAKIVNQLTLARLLKAAGNMPKSTHRLIKLVRAKYEHACMIHDSVENIDAFVEKYIYEYRGFLFRIHTWRQIEILSIWFSGILAAVGASAYYLFSGFSESVYQYIAGGIAEMVLLAVVSSLSDEPYKIRALKMYMVDYLDNICAFRLRRQKTSDRDFIDVIASENSGKAAFQPAFQGSSGTVSNASREASREAARDSSREFAQDNSRMETSRAETRADDFRTDNSRTDTLRSENVRPENDSADNVRGAVRTQSEMYMPASGENQMQVSRQEGTEEKSRDSGRGIFRKASQRQESRLSINIEGEPRIAEKGDSGKNGRKNVSVQEEDEDRPVLREEAIRQILEEFLA